MKIYYNLTKINNGWMLKRPDISDPDSFPTGLTVEEYFGTLKEALRAIDSIQIAIDKLLKS